MADSPAYQGLLVRGPNGADYKCFIPASQAGAEAAAHGAAGAGHEPSLKHLKGGIARLRASCLQSVPTRVVVDTFRAAWCSKEATGPTRSVPSAT